MRRTIEAALILVLCTACGETAQSGGSAGASGSAGSGGSGASGMGGTGQGGTAQGGSGQGGTAQGGSGQGGTAEGGGGQGGAAQGGGGQGGTAQGGGGQGGTTGLACEGIRMGKCDSGTGGAPENVAAYDACFQQCASDAECSSGRICVRNTCRTPCTAEPIPTNGTGGTGGYDGYGYVLQHGECMAEEYCVRDGSQRLYCACIPHCVNGDHWDTGDCYI